VRKPDSILKPAILRQAYRVFERIPQFPRLERYFKTLADMPVIQKVLALEGLTPVS